MSSYEKIAFVVVSVYGYVAVLAGLRAFLVVTCLILFNFFVYHIVIATEARVLEGIIEVGFGLLLLTIRRPVARLISERLEAESVSGEDNASEV
jgi:tellurite resistance protein TehA-like permease